MLRPPRGRPPTDSEVREYQRSFPGLTHFSVTGEIDDSYDCVSFTLTPHAPTKLRPSPDLVRLGGLEALDSFYREKNFRRVKRAPRDPAASCVAIFAVGEKPTHVALRDHLTVWWESKLGTGIRILHPLTALEGGRYGAVIGYYASRAARASARGQPAPSPSFSK